MSKTRKKNVNDIYHYYLVREQPEENYGSLNVKGWNMHFTKIEFWVEFSLDFDVYNQFMTLILI